MTFQIKAKLALTLCLLLFIIVACQETEQPQVDKHTTNNLGNSLETTSTDAQEAWLPAIFSQYLEDVVPATTNGSIGGFLWNDLNGNGSRDTGESLFSSRTVYIDFNNNSNLDGGEPSLFNGLDSGYSFLNLAAGTYTIRQVLPTNWIQTYPIPPSAGHVINLSAGQNVFNIDFGSRDSTLPINSYDIELVLGSSMTASQTQAFQNAVNRWEAVITGDLGNSVTISSHPCFSGTLTGRTVDDLVIYASIEPIDGPYGILGSAGPYFIRSSSKLPISGCMRFDSADVAIMEANGSFEDVILHEMGHILGVGTIWDNLNLDSSCPLGFEFTGTATKSEWLSLGGTGNTPIEDLGGSGTQCGHWKESIFDSELMTGISEGGTVLMPLSRLTIAQFIDLGYTADMTQADSYSLPACSGACLVAQPVQTNQVREEILQPVFEIDDDNQVILIP